MSNNLTIGLLSSDVLLKDLYRCGVALFDEQSNDVASGTLVSCGDSVLIATAKHAIPNDISRIQVLPDHARRTSQGILKARSSERHPTLDVGFLEIPGDSVNEYFQDKRPCELSRLKCLGAGDCRQMSALCGCPTQFGSPGPAGSGIPWVARMMGFASTALDVSEWQSRVEDADTSEKADVILDYPETGCINVETRKEIRLESPVGFSGGGIWSAEFKEGKIWYSERSVLYAIQSAWHSDRRYIRAIQIVHWLNLVRSRRAGLRMLIESEFPEVARLDCI